MSDPNRKVSNPLLNNAVTGGTFEDFSHNAILLPAKEKEPTPAPVPTFTPEQLPVIEDNQNVFATIEPNFVNSQFQQSTLTPENYFYVNPHEPIAQLQQPHPSQDNYYYGLNPSEPVLQPQQSNISSVFSSFSSILKLNKSSTPPVKESPPPVAFIPTLEPSNAPPVPLFTPSDVPSPSQPPPTQGPVNTYRRTGLKKPTYAQVPGLFTQPQVPQAEPVPSTNTFKPISPQPPTVALTPITEPPASQTFFTPEQSSSFQSPVMTAMPADEIMQGPSGHPVHPLGMELNEESLPSANVLPTQIYRPVYNHWFHKRELEGKVIWEPFSMADSLALEEAFTSNDLDPDKVVATDGGRYDVNILRRQRVPVYWKGGPTEVRRCSWFHKGSADGRYIPYEENTATKLEDEFRAAYEANQWHRKVELQNGETVVFHAPDVLVLFPPTQSPDAWGNTPTQLRPRIVKRGMDEFDIDDGEPAKVDHLLFIVHGIGSVCDLKFRTVEEVVDEFRSISLQLVQSHYKSSCERGLVNRVEVLPISWHEELHSENTGIDSKLKSITLQSIPRLRDFTNDTLLDILFYTSPVYCQTIISTVGNQLNKIYDLFKQRNPDFDGGVSLGGHSLGSLILFDLLCHQYPEPEKTSSDEDDPLHPAKPPPTQRRMSKRISYMMSAIGTWQPQIHYPNLSFHPKAFFALGSPIGMFVTVRGLNTLGEQFALPTCPAFFNIFHPYDPVAYRIESLINPDLSQLKPVLIPHHKGRKRMHLEFRETMSRVGADLKQRILDSMKNTWNSFYQLAMSHRQDPAALEVEVDKALQEQLRKTEETEHEEPEQQLTDLPLGSLNSNRRVDYVLQEGPLEFINDYIFALTSHVCYWESEDTMLMILKEIYNNMDISADDKIPQQTMTIERPPSSSKSSRPPSISKSDIGMDPTVPLQMSSQLGPPPMSGFVRKP